MSGLVQKWRRVCGRVIIGTVIIAGLAAAGWAGSVLTGVAAEPVTRATNRWL